MKHTDPSQVRLVVDPDVENAVHTLCCTYPDEKTYDYVLSTDGSCCPNGYGGYAACVRRKGENSSMLTSGSAEKTSVNRMEFMALIEGLRLIHRDILNSDDPESERYIIWVTDRESLAKALMRKPSGAPLYTGKCDEDLWAQLKFFRKRINVHPKPIPRNTTKDQEYCDYLAGFRRQNILQNVSRSL